MIKVLITDRAYPNAEWYIADIILFKLGNKYKVYKTRWKEEDLNKEFRLSLPELWN